MDALGILHLSPVMPVIVVHDAGLAADLAAALVAGGIRSLEVTLRTPAALAVIRRMRDAVPDAWVGAGTVLDGTQWQQARDAGAQFGVSPGLTRELAGAVRAAPEPFLPGVATVSEAMCAREQGFSTLKFFPAEAAGGRALLKSLHGPLPELRFCPTGGIHPGNAPDYLALPNVVCVGGSWLVPEDAVAARDWVRITAMARAAAALGGKPAAA